MIARVLVDASQSFESVENGREAVRQEVARLIKESSRAELKADSKHATHFVRVEIGPVSVSPTRGDTVRPITLTISPLKEGRPWMVVGRGPPEGDLLHSVTEGLQEAWALIERQRRLDVAKDAALIEVLAEPDPRMRTFAVERLGERKSKAAVEPLLAMLNDNTEQALVLRAIGALVAIGDPRAVKPIIELSNRQDPAFVLQVVFAVGAIGGRAAEAYLVTMASGHPVEPVRQGAEDALRELEKRKQMVGTEAH